MPLISLQYSNIHFDLDVGLFVGSFFAVLQEPLTIHINCNSAMLKLTVQCCCIAV